MGDLASLLVFLVRLEPFADKVDRSGNHGDDEDHPHEVDEFVAQEIHIPKKETDHDIEA